MFRPRQRILYYCQSLVGIGHLTASLQIIKALIEHFDVDLIYGGVQYSNFPKLSGFRILQLPALVFNEGGELFSPALNFTIEEVWRRRQELIGEFTAPIYQAIIFEFYPFGRRRFKKEIRALIAQVRGQSGNIPLLSQIREILIPNDFATEQLILDELNAQFHSVLVRGDPEVIKLDETFSLAAKLGDRLFYAGYISEPASDNCPERQPQILVSQGGGNVGQQLLIAAIQAAPLLPEYRFMIAVGSSASAADLKRLQSQAISSNVEVLPFLTNFRERLSSSALSINMGGDNTLLDVIATKTPSLAYPYPGNSEQALRINRLAGNGWVTPVEESDLDGNALAARIKATLARDYPARSIKLDGAATICNKVRQIIGH